MAQNPKIMLQNALQKEGTTHIKLLGDSITHGVGGTGFAQNGAPIAGGFSRNPDGYCWAKRFKDELESRFDCEVVNNGCTGTKIEFIIEHFDTLVDETDDFILCTIGTNNRNKYFATGEKPTKEAYMAEFYANILKLWEMLKAAGKGDKVVFAANIPAADIKECDGTTFWRVFHMWDVNEMYRRAAAERDFPLISLYELFGEYCKKNGLMLESLLTDGLHPNDKGYDVMYSIICREFGL